jgi:hypothetical protein
MEQVTPRQVQKSGEMVLLHVEKADPFQAKQCFPFIS